MKVNKNMMRYLMWTMPLAMLTASCGVREQGAADSALAGINVGNRRPIAEVQSAVTAGHYAVNKGYYNTSDTTLLREGMAVLFSASYGSGGGEAGQARGVLVRCDSFRGVAGAVKWQDGDLCFKPQANTTMQLLLAPGQEMQSPAARPDAAKSAPAAAKPAPAAGGRTGLMWAIVVVAVLSLAAVGAKVAGLY